MLELDYISYPPIHRYKYDNIINNLKNMKLECVKDKFQKTFSKVEKISNKGGSNPILKCVFMEAKGSTLTLRATNLDLGIEATLPVKIEEGGSIAVSGAILGNFISLLDKEKSLKFEKKEDSLQVSSERASSSFKLYSQDEFPIIPHVSAEKSFSIASKDLIKGLKSVSYSASLSTIKPELASVYIYPEEESLVFVATDSFRLAEKKIKTKIKLDFDQILIPFKNVSDIIRVLEEKDEIIEVSFDKNQVSFTSEDFYLVSRVIEGTFPSYKQIIPKESKTEVVVLKQDFLNTLKIAHVFSDSFNRVTFIVSPSAKTLEIKTKNNDIGENITKISASLSGEDIQISFNYKNIFDCFQSIDADSISLSFDGLNKAMIMRGVGDKTFFYLVMPMNK